MVEHRRLGLFLLAQANLKGFEHAEQVQDAGRRDEPRAVIARRARNVGARGLDRVRQEIKDASAEIGQESESAKGIAGRREDVAAQAQANYCEGANSNEIADGLAPFAQQRGGRGRARSNLPRRRTRLAADSLLLRSFPFGP